MGLRLYCCPLGEDRHTWWGCLDDGLFIILDGQDAPLPQIVIFGVLTLISLLLMGQILLAIRPDADPTSTVSASDTTMDP